MRRYEALDFRAAGEAALDLSRAGNKYMDDMAPWTLFKEGKIDEGCQASAVPPPPSRTNWTRLVPPPVLTECVASLLPYARGRDRFRGVGPRVAVQPA